MRTTIFALLLLGHSHFVHGAEDAVIPKQDALGHIRTRAILEDNPAITAEDFVTQWGDKATYTKEEVMGYAPTPKIKTAADFGFQGLKLRLRQSFSDVTAVEDPSLSKPGADTFDDVKGALLSFTRDFEASTDTWAAQGTLLAPLIWTRLVTTQKGSPFRLRTSGIIPSVSIHRVSSNAKTPKGEVDQVIYRTGVFGKWISGHALKAQTVRGFVSYATDLEQQSGLYAAELEWEPHIFANKYLRVGHNTILWPQSQEKRNRDKSDTSRLSYQLRLIAHAEVGRFEDIGDRPPATANKEQEFVRLGPIVHFELNPLFSRHLSLSMSYRYLPTLSGRSENDSLFTADAEWVLIDPKEKPGVQLSLKASYTNGGLDLTHDKAETFILGLGAAF